MDWLNLDSPLWFFGIAALLIPLILILRRRSTPPQQGGMTPAQIQATVAAAVAAAIPPAAAGGVPPAAAAPAAPPAPPATARATPARGRSILWRLIKWPVRFVLLAAAFVGGYTWWNHQDAAWRESTKGEFLAVYYPIRYFGSDVVVLRKKGEWSGWQSTIGRGQYSYTPLYPQDATYNWQARSTRNETSRILDHGANYPFRAGAAAMRIQSVENGIQIFKGGFSP